MRNNRTNDSVVSSILDEIEMDRMMQQEGIEKETINTLPVSNICNKTYAAMGEERMTIKEDSFLDALINGAMSFL
jgi:hypothetical protein